MKIAFIFGLVVLLTGCAQEKQLTFFVEDLNVEAEKEVFSSGIYYRFENGKDIDAELILNKLVDNDVPLTEAWYKPYASSCCPPNTNRCMDALVRPVFLIRLTEETESKDFIRIENPDIGWCAYNVEHYILK